MIPKREKHKSSGKKLPKEIVICSYGLEPKHITLETITELESCGKVFVVAFPSVKKETMGFLKKYCRNAECICLFKPQEQARIISDALSNYSRVGVLVYGNPAFLNSLTCTIRHFLRDKDVSIKALSAISSFDALLILLDNRNLLDSHCAEFYIFGFLDWSRNNIRFHPSAANIVCELYYLLEPEYADARKRFLFELKKQYPKNHKVYFIQCAAVGNLNSELSVLKVSEIKNAFQKLTHKTTMFIPPLKNVDYSHERKLL